MIANSWQAMGNIMADSFISAEQACKYANISRRTLTTRINDSGLKCEYRRRKLYVERKGLESLYSEQISYDLVDKEAAESLLKIVLSELTDIRKVNHQLLENNLVITEQILELKKQNILLLKVLSEKDVGNITNAATIPSNNKAKAKQSVAGKKPAITNQSVMDKKPVSKNGRHDKRIEQAKLRLFAALDKLDEIPMYKGKISLNATAKATGIDRSIVTKHIAEYLENRA